jgi:hypothetical protein
LRSRPVTKPRFDKHDGHLYDAEFATLTQQVAGLDSAYNDLRAVVVNLDRKIDEVVTNLDRRIDESFVSLGAKIDAKSATPWASIWAAAAVALSFMTIIGYLSLRPIDNEITEIKTAIISEHTYDREESNRVNELQIRVNQRLAIIDSRIGFIEGFMASGPPSEHNKFVPPR